MADIFETIGDWLGLNKGKATQKAAEQIAARSTSSQPPAATLSAA